MAPLPLLIAAPVAAASMAYVNARTGLSNDIGSLVPFVRSRLAVSRAEANERMNMFYVLEEHALSPKTANVVLLATPPTIPKEYDSTHLHLLECEEWTYRQVYDTVLKYAAWLKQEHLVHKNDIIALNFTNKPQFVFIWFAIWSLGAKVAFINTNLRDKSLLHCLLRCSAKLALFDPDLRVALTPEVLEELAKANTERKPIKVVVVEQALQVKITQMGSMRVDDKERAGQTPLDLATLIFTSGTTGMPKAAHISWRKMYAGSKYIGIWLNFARDERYYSALPLYHSAGSFLGFLIALQTGVTYILSPHFSPRTFFASATASRATSFQYIGEMCRYLLSTPPSPADTAHSIRRAFGNGIRPDVFAPFKARFAIPEICEFYSATESTGASLIKIRNDFNIGAVGRNGLLLRLLTRSATATVVHDTETGMPWRSGSSGFCERVRTGEVGEMLEVLDADNISDKFLGYHGDAAATQAKILRDVFVPGDAWYRTGDLLRTDGEGRTFFVDRVGDTFRWKGENVSTSEVAEALTQHAAIGEVNVYGVQLPGHDGRAGCAAVVLLQESNQDLMTDLARHVRAKLPGYAVPIFLRVVKGFEMTGTSKYTKHALRTEGVDPSKSGQDRLFWLAPQANGYEPFEEGQWRSLGEGSARL